MTAQDNSDELDDSVLAGIAGGAGSVARSGFEGKHGDDWTNTTAHVVSGPDHASHVHEPTTPGPVVHHTSIEEPAVKPHGAPAVGGHGEGTLHHHGSDTVAQHHKGEHGPADLKGEHGKPEHQTGEHGKPEHHKGEHGPADLKGEHGKPEHHNGEHEKGEHGKGEHGKAEGTVASSQTGWNRVHNVSTTGGTIIP